MAGAQEGLRRGEADAAAQAKPRTVWFMER